MSLFKKAMKLTPAYQSVKLIQKHTNKDTTHDKATVENKLTTNNSGQTTEAFKAPKKMKTLPLKYTKLDGTYMATHPKLPKPNKRLVLLFSKRGIDQQRAFHNPIQLFGWDEVTGFDFTGDVMNGVFTATLSTTTGDLVLETASFHASDAGGNQMWADNRRKKLNKIKILVMQQTRSAKTA